MAAALVDVALDAKSPVYIRLDREKQPALYDSCSEFKSGFTVFGHSSDVCIVSTGCMVKNALRVSESLNKKSVGTKVIDVYKLKPINVSEFLDELRGSKKVFTLEEHSVNGGLGSIVSEILTDSDHPVSLKRLAVPNGEVFAYGIREDLHKHWGLDVDSIEHSIMQYV